MKQRKLGWLSILIAITLLSSLIAGCSKSVEETKPSGNGGEQKPASENEGASIGEKVELTWYTVGVPHKDTPLVMEKFNEMVLRDFNATVNLNFMGWDDWETKYNLLLTTGEKIDAIFASSWAKYFQYANDGAFMDITNLIPQYMPESAKAVPQQDWEEVKVGGKIYAVPSTYTEYTPYGLIYREDWRTKYNLPEPTDLDSMEQYLEGIKKNESEVIPLNGGVYMDVRNLYESFTGLEKIANEDDNVIKIKSYQTPGDIIAYPFTDEYVTFVKRMKQWADKGFWSKNTLSSKVGTWDTIQTGTSAAGNANPSGAQFLIDTLKINHPDYELAYFPYTRFHNYVYSNLAINNGTAIPATATNPERSLMVLDKLRNDPAYFNLMLYGIEGNHFDLTEDGQHLIVPAKGQDPATNTGYDIPSWGWRNDPLMKTREGQWPGQEELKKEFDSIKVPNLFAALVIDYNSVQAEFSAVNQVMQQYGRPLMLGLVPDVDKAVTNYREKLQKAGIDKVIAVVKEQMYAFYDEKGIAYEKQ